jgi:hypothetical protein
LVFASLLATRGLESALTAPIGMDPQNVVTAAFDLDSAGYGEEQSRLFQGRALAAVRTIPGVTAAAYCNSLPLSIDQSTTHVSAMDEPAMKGRNGQEANYYQISPGLLQTLGVQLLRGRDFDGGDRRDAPLVAIVNQTFARRVLKGENTVGLRFRNGFGGPLIQVVGIVRNGKYGSLTEDPRSVVFWPIAQRYNPTTTLVLRSGLPAPEIVAAVRRKIAALDPRLPVYGAGRVGGDRSAPPLVEPDMQISRIRLSRRSRLRHAQAADGTRTE